MKPKTTWGRKALTILSVPLLAIPSAVGVYQFLEAHGNPIAAGMAAAGFELLYIGINVLPLSSRLQSYARRVALASVATAILMNALAHYGNAAPWDIGLMAVSLIASAPLAALAYAVSVLLHKLSEEESDAATIEQTLAAREQALTGREQALATIEQTLAAREQVVTGREQQPTRIEQVEVIRVASAELTWKQFEQVIKKLTSDAPSMSTIRRLVASAEGE